MSEYLSTISALSSSAIQLLLLMLEMLTTGIDQRDCHSSLNYTSLS